MTSFGFIKEGKNQRKSKPLDELATNDSIFLEEKWCDHFNSTDTLNYNRYVVDLIP